MKSLKQYFEKSLEEDSRWCTLSADLLHQEKPRPQMNAYISWKGTKGELQSSAREWQEFWREQRGGVTTQRKRQNILQIWHRQPQPGIALHCQQRYADCCYCKGSAVNDSKVLWSSLALNSVWRIVLGEGACDCFASEKGITLVSFPNSQEMLCMEPSEHKAAKPL